MSATDTLREDHRHVRRFDSIITRCYTALYDGRDVPLDDIERITRVMEELLDSIHYSREEDSYFPCVTSYDHLRREIHVLLVEHEFSRRVAVQIRRYLRRWREAQQQQQQQGGGGIQNPREPVARYMRAYSVYISDHLSKEEDFFDRAEAEILSKEEEYEMYEQFRSVMATSKKLDDLLAEVDYLESRPWTA